MTKDESVDDYSTVTLELFFCLEITISYDELLF